MQVCLRKPSPFAVTVKYEVGNLVSVFHIPAVSAVLRPLCYQDTFSGQSRSLDQGFHDPAAAANGRGRLGRQAGNRRIAGIIPFGVGTARFENRMKQLKRAVVQRQDPVFSSLDPLHVDQFA